MHRITVATDFSERSDRALRRAVLLGKEMGATIALVHVIDDDQPVRIVEAEREAALYLLREQASTLKDADGLSCETRVVLSAPHTGIIQAAEDDAADLLVIGPHRRQVLRDVFMGTTAERTIRGARRPVLMANAPPVGPYRHILLTTELSDESRDALEAFTTLGIGRRARHSILRVFDAPALGMATAAMVPKDNRDQHMEDETAQAASELARFVGSLNGPFEQNVRHNQTSPATVIVETANEQAADLIVVGTRARRGLARLFLGSVAEEILRIADRDVLVVPRFCRPAG